MALLSTFKGAEKDRNLEAAPDEIANFAVLEDDPYAVAPTKLKDIRAWGAVFDGAVYPVERGWRTARLSTPGGQRIEEQTPNRPRRLRGDRLHQLRCAGLYSFHL
jgi:hypothetical protein